MLRGLGEAVRSNHIGVVRVDAERGGVEHGASEGGAEGARPEPGGPAPDSVGGEIQPRWEGPDLGGLWAPLCEGEESVYH